MWVGSAYSHVVFRCIYACRLKACVGRKRAIFDMTRTIVRTKQTIEGMAKHMKELHPTFVSSVATTAGFTCGRANNQR